MPVDPPIPYAPETATGRIVPTVALLSFVAGSMDVIAFLGLGEVFTSAMSGNTVLLGIGIAQGNFAGALRALTSVAGYVVGVAIASLRFGRSTRGGWKLAIEVLFIVAFAGLWFGMGGPVRPWLGFVLIGLSSIAMGVQGAIGRMIGVSGLMTVVFTSTYTAVVSSVIERAWVRQWPVLTRQTRQRLIALAVYLAGALIGGAVATHALSIAPVVPLVGIFMLVLGLALRTCELGSARA